MTWLRLVGILALGIGAACGDNAFRSDEGRFSVQMPASPQYQVIDVDPADPTPMHLFTVARGTTTYMVAFADIPVKGRETGEVLDGARDNALAKPGRSLLAERSVSLDGNPGRELEVAAPNDIFMRIRIFLVGERLYQVGVISKGQNALAEGTQFLESFKVF